MEPTGKRKLAATLTADAIGCSRLMGQDEQATLVAGCACRQIFTEKIEAHGSPRERDSFVRVATDNDGVGARGILDPPQAVSDGMPSESALSFLQLLFQFFCRVDGEPAGHVTAEVGGGLAPAAHRRVA